MSTSKRRFVATGLSVAASMALAIGVGAVTEDPSPGGSSAASRTPDRREQFLLLTDGRMIHGVISREGSLYVVSQKLGTMRFPKKLVEGSFASIRDAFRHKERRLPEEDPAERVKLARWCMNLQLTAEAKEQLVKVLEISPDHGPAQAMLANMEYTEKRQANQFDPEVRQTAAEEVAEDRPGAHDSAVLRGAEREMGLTGLPVIFNLPRPLAIRRAEEFARYIQPLLQIKCAKCHNAGYEGMFQLVPIATPRQQTPDALRANLDATLRLVDSENPARSELLSSTLRPHGLGARKRPIFTGSNDRAYRILETWVNSLRPPGYLNANGSPVARSGSDPVEAFGSDRSRPAGSSLDSVVSGMTPRQGGGTRMPAQAAGPNTHPAYRYQPGQGMVSEDLLQADPKEFPLPYLLGGPKPTPSVKTTPRPRNRAGSAPSEDQAIAGSSRSPARGTAAPENADTMPSVSTNAPTTVSSKADPGMAKKPSKPVKIDPAILEKLLRRNADRAPSPQP
jgi:hypothetical protein